EAYPPEIELPATVKLRYIPPSCFVQSLIKGMEPLIMELYFLLLSTLILTCPSEVTPGMTTRTSRPLLPCASISAWTFAEGLKVLEDTSTTSELMVTKLSD